MKILIGYIDPGSGSVVLQFLVGGSVAALYTGRRFITGALGQVKKTLVRGQAPEDNKKE